MLFLLGFTSCAVAQDTPVSLEHAHHSEAAKGSLG